MWLFPKGLVRDHTVWDTQLAEYLLTGQQSSYASLDEVSVKYGGVLKDDRVKEFWEAGVQTEAIPTDMLADYLMGDISNTEIVYLAQVELAKKYGMLPLIESQMRALLATTLMEYNGMQVDLAYIKEQSKRLAVEIGETETLLSSSLPSTDMPSDWLWSSPKDVSMLLFGGTHIVKEKHHVGQYKNGKDKYKVVDVEHRCTGLGLEPSRVGANPTKTGYYTVDETVLKNCTHPIAKQVLQLRTLSKQRETYYENMRSLTFPDGCIHPNLNHVTTKTGRLSCNKPNIQNQTIEGGIKKAYVSRWGIDGRLVDFDYSQLEMAGLAAIADDTQLSYDINHGIDMHTELYKEMYGRTCTKDERKKFKPLSFGLVYGAGAKTLAANAGCTVAEARKFIKVFYGRYKGVGKFHSTIMDEAVEKRRLTTKRSPKGFPLGVYTKRMPTGRMYVFSEYDNEWKGGVSFSPTELKNWPVQGFATGDVVPHMVGLIVEKLYKSDLYKWCVPVMTVHDSIVFDVKEEYVDKFVKACYSVLKNTTAFINHYFNIEMPVTLSVGCSVGKNWQDLEEVELSKYD
jgi:DNA polymerase I-like protein with 3'-5' exonuclease and polymerase domains